MTDKSIGTIWHKLHKQRFTEKDTMFLLIRKLVEERTAKHAASCLSDACVLNHKVDPFMHLPEALSDFGITEEEWEGRVDVNGGCG